MVRSSLLVALSALFGTSGTLAAPQTALANIVISFPDIPKPPKKLANGARLIDARRHPFSGRAHTDEFSEAMLLCGITEFRWEDFGMYHDPQLTLKSSAPRATIDCIASKVSDDFYVRIGTESRR